MISIIGAGPCGSHAAYLLAKAGLEVSVFEEHKNIGEPVQCTGITTPALGKIIDLKRDFVANTINKTRIYAPNKEFIEIKIRENTILNRKSFDAHLAKKAKKQGARLFLKHKFLSFKRKRENIIIKVKDNKNRVKQVKANILIGADGPLSSVAKSAGMFRERRFFIGLQSVIEEANNNIVEFYPLRQGMAWVVPESKGMVRAGIAVKENMRNNYTHFMKNRFGRHYRKSVKSQQAGLIPIYNPRLATQKQSIFLVGDAATQVKATSLGGIVPGLMAAQALAKSIIRYESYERNWKRTIGRELWLHLKIRNILDNFSDGDYNKLIKLCNNKKIKNILGKYDREYPSKILFRMLLAEPRLMYFGKYFHKLF
jgi:geranylgeranyl reductase family protein